MFIKPKLQACGAEGIGHALMDRQSYELTLAGATDKECGTGGLKVGGGHSRT